MKIKQQTLKGFECEIENAEAFIEYYTKNEPLLQGHLLILRGNVDESVKAYLDDKNAIYVDTNTKNLSTRKKHSNKDVEFSMQKIKNECSKIENKSSLYKRTIRSGETIQSQSNLVIAGRINNGAVIKSTSSIQIFGTIDGLVESDGEYMLLKDIGKGSVFFHGEELDKSQFNGQLKLVEYINASIVIKEMD